MEKIIEFLKLNGYKETDSDTFEKDGVSQIDISQKEIILSDEGETWLHLPVNLYALIGALIHHRQLACNYKHL